MNILSLITRSILLGLCQSSPFSDNKNDRKITNMNGDYTISNGDTTTGVEWSGDYGLREDVEFFEVYSPPISTRYGEVFWKMMDPVPLDEDLVQRFNGKVMAVVGYEVDQVMKTDNGDVSVPITHAYNHHYCAWLKSRLKDLVKVEGKEAINDKVHNPHGAPFYHRTVRNNKEDPNPDSEVPLSWFISEGNGGEFRKSFHGYPKGRAQLLDSPTSFHITPMQIDTKNRHYDGPDFRPDIMPAESAAPPNASYSGLLECPCTDRIVKQWEVTYSTEVTDKCITMVDNSAECFVAAAKVTSTDVFMNQTVSDSKHPYGCSVIQYLNGSMIAYSNSLEDSSAKCGGSQVFQGSYSASASGATITVLLNETVHGGLATITLSGPSENWFAFGFNTPNFAMSDTPYTIVVDGTGAVTERKLADQAPGNLITSSLRVTSNTVQDNVRTVVMTRPFTGKTSDHYTFSATNNNIPMITASGTGPTFSYHGPKQRTGGTVQLVGVNSATCICNAGVKGTINGIPFNNERCLPQPYGDLVQMKNPTCRVQTYQGGLQCCHHGTVLLDKDQTQPEDVLTYHMKYRFYYQPYTTGSHTNLIRLYYQTEAWASEYDVVQCPPGTPSSQCFQEITAHFTIRDMLHNCSARLGDQCAGDMDKHKGINLIYAGGHCHAPSCISMELYNGDTGQLLCAHYPTVGQSHDVFDELGYIAIPPCLFGDPEEGLISPPFLTYDTHLTSVKKANNTYNHYGQMAQWQMRGVLANQ